MSARTNAPRRRRARARIALVLVLGALVPGAGCAEVPVEPERTSLELGSGTFRFEPLADGDGAPLVKGAQGGWHIWVAVRAHGLESDAGSLAIEIQPADESAPPQRTTIGVRFDPPDAEGRRSYLGWPAILSDPACDVGRLLRIEATLTTPSGERLRAERYVMPTPGDDPPPQCGASPPGVPVPAG
ncbi:MAG: hypothetical protein M3Y87_14070 [Myxococcota bacterium]|nr:hypothetical protein [Myxococcota bacterium]